MIDRVVEIRSSECFLHKEQGFLCIQRKSEAVASVDFDTIGAVVVAAPDAVMTRGVLDELARREIVLLICGPNYQPTGFLLPLPSSGPTAERLQAQVLTSKPKKKQIWKAIVQQKIHNQRLILEVLDHSETAAFLERFESEVCSGDSTNREAQAARSYWTALMGKEFRRDSDMGGGQCVLKLRLRYLA